MWWSKHVMFPYMSSLTFEKFLYISSFSWIWLQEKRFYQTHKLFIIESGFFMDTFIFDLCIYRPSGHANYYTMSDNCPNTVILWKRGILNRIKYFPVYSISILNVSFECLLFYLPYLQSIRNQRNNWSFPSLLHLLSN